MFGTNHFIWLGILTVAIIVGVILSKKYKLDTLTLLTIVCACCVLSEVVKLGCVLIQEERVVDGAVYIKESDLPFHLCSMQIFLAFIARFTKSSGVRDFCLTFMIPTCILGGIAAMMIPTISTAFTNPRSYQYFIYHAALVWFGCAIIAKGEVKLDFRAFGKTLVGLFVAVMIGFYINGWTQKTNFLYLSEPPMDGLPILNMDNGWFVYFLSYMGLAIALIALFFAPFWIIYARRAKKEREASKVAEDTASVC